MAPVGSNGTPTQPIPIEGHRRRSSSASESSEDSTSPTTPFTPGVPFQAPSGGVPPRIPQLSPSSPILSYFLAQPSPTSKSPSSTFPLRRNFGPPLNEDDDVPEGQSAGPQMRGRRASTAWTTKERLAQPPANAPPEQHDRAAGVLRRLSLGGALGRPQIPSLKPAGTDAGGMRGQIDRSRPLPSTDAPPMTQTPRTPRRANTISPRTPRPPRAPSPMGERILKGHFDGFN